MSSIDRQRIQVVRLLERLGHRSTGFEWVASAETSVKASRRSSLRTLGQDAKPIGGFGNLRPFDDRGMLADPWELVTFRRGRQSSSSTSRHKPLLSSDFQCMTRRQRTG
jgi:hypothetical protein